MTQADLARKVGAATRSVTSWEAGDATPHPNYNAKLNELFADQIPHEEMVAGPRLKEATVPELLAELQLRFAHLARVTRQAQPKGSAQ
ncbi:hypothetical protein ACQPZA_20575 [Pseudonocardia xinjiangensis]|uniref:hypothetical protein n=1 Tax=Pseudonocardia xinjiangensis TaxID=75289 RepID=UPI003D94D85D